MNYRNVLDRINTSANQYDCSKNWIKCVFIKSDWNQFFKTKKTFSDCLRIHVSFKWMFFLFWTLPIHYSSNMADTDREPVLLCSRILSYGRRSVSAPVCYEHLWRTMATATPPWGFEWMAFAVVLVLETFVWADGGSAKFIVMVSFYNL